MRVILGVLIRIGVPGPVNLLAGPGRMSPPKLGLLAIRNEEVTDTSMRSAPDEYWR